MSTKKAGQHPRPAQSKAKGAKATNIIDPIAAQPLADGTYEIRELLKKRKGKAGRIEYLVSWKGYDSSENTWEPETGLPAWMVRDFAEKMIGASAAKKGHGSAAGAGGGAAGPKGRKRAAADMMVGSSDTSGLLGFGGAAHLHPTVKKSKYTCTLPTSGCPLRGNAPNTCACRSILAALLENVLAAPFREPVDPVALGLPNYFDVVKRPMDLGTVGRKLRETAYAAVSDLLADCRLVWANAMLYNEESSNIYEMARRLSDDFERRFTTAARGMTRGAVQGGGGRASSSSAHGGGGGGGQGGGGGGGGSCRASEHGAAGREGSGAGAGGKAGSPRGAGGRGAAGGAGAGSGAAGGAGAAGEPTGLKKHKRKLAAAVAREQQQREQQQQQEQQQQRWRQQGGAGSKGTRGSKGGPSELDFGMHAVGDEAVAATFGAGPDGRGMAADDGEEEGARSAKGAEEAAAAEEEQCSSDPAERALREELRRVSKNHSDARVPQDAQGRVVKSLRKCRLRGSAHNTGVCKACLKRLRAHKFAHVFHEQAHQAVLRSAEFDGLAPLDTATVAAALDSGRYELVDDLLRDVRKVWSDAMLRAPSHGHIVFALAQTLSRVFEADLRGAVSKLHGVEWEVPAHVPQMTLSQTATGARLGSSSSGHGGGGAGLPAAAAAAAALAAAGPSPGTSPSTMGRMLVNPMMMMAAEGGAGQLGFGRGGIGGAGAGAGGRGGAGLGGGGGGGGGIGAGRGGHYNEGRLGSAPLDNPGLYDYWGTTPQASPGHSPPLRPGMPDEGLMGGLGSHPSLLALPGQSSQHGEAAFSGDPALPTPAVVGGIGSGITVFDSIELDADSPSAI